MGKGCRRGACAPLGYRSGADAEGLFHCTLHLRAFFGALLLGVAAPGRRALGPRATDPIFSH